MSYRPITDVWFLARAKLKGGRKYYGAYLGGFPERARVLLGASIDDPVLHVCGGMARFYPYAGGFGPNDKTLDLDPATEPDYLQDAREPFPAWTSDARRFRAYLIDPPYSEQDAEHYVPGRTNYPSPSHLVGAALRALPLGGRVGIIHYIVAKPGPHAPNAKFVAAVAVMCGFNNRVRAFSVWEKR